jgi:hypothetical protein
MSGRPRVPEILLMSSRVESEDGAGGSRRVGQLRKLHVSRPQASLCAGACVCVRATTAAGLACLHRAHPHLPGDPCAHRPGPQLILLTRIAVPVQWRCRQSKNCKTLHGRMSWTPRGCQLLHLSSRSMDSRARATCRSWTRRIWWYCAASSSRFKASSCVNGFRDPQLLPSGTSLQHVQCHFWRGSDTCYLELAMQSQYNKRNL